MPKCCFTILFSLNKYILSFITHYVQCLAAFLKIVLFISFVCTFYLMMNIGSEVDPNDNKDVVPNINEKEDKYIEYSSEKNASKKEDLKSLPMKKPRETEKRKKISSTFNKPTHQRKYFWPPAPPKRKPAPTVSIRMSNPQAQIVLEERKVEIKDLESQVVYLQKQLKESKAENRTLLDVQNRQSKELKKYCGGVTDLPVLIRSHNDEIKAIQSNASLVRKELRMCQSDLKTKTDLLLRRDQELIKLRLTLKNSEQNAQEMSIGNRRFNRENKKLEDETDKLLNENKELKSKTEKMQKIIQQLTNRAAELEEALSTEGHVRKQLKDDFKELQSKYDEACKNVITFKKSLEVPKVMSTTQTDRVETINTAMMTLDISKEPECLSSEKVSIGVQATQDGLHLQCTNSEEIKSGDNLDEEECCYLNASKDQFTALDVYPDIFNDQAFIISKPPSHAGRTGIRKQMYTLSNELSKLPSEVKRPYRDSMPLSAYELLEKPPGSSLDKKSTPLSNVFYNTTFCTKGPLRKSNTLLDTSFNLDFKPRKDIDNNSNLYFKESSSRNILKKSSSRIESSLECKVTGRKDSQNDTDVRILETISDTSLKAKNSNTSRNDLFSNWTSKQNTMYPNG